MLKHIVLFKFKPETTDPEIEAWLKTLQELPQHIHSIRLWEIGREMTGRVGANYEICLISGFDNAADLDAYDKHPAHLVVVTEARRLCAHIARTNFWAA